MRTARWMIERKYERDREVLQVIEVYGVGENKETVKKENKRWSYERSLLLVEGGAE